jgi:ATP-dependent helicase YprA (DUF1998 family)
MTDQALVDLSDTFRKYADAANDFADNCDNPLDPSLAQLRTTAAHLSVDAAIIAQKQLDDLAQDVTDAISALETQVIAAQNTLAVINDIKTGVSIATSVLSAAAAVASGNFTGAVTQVIALGNTIANAIRGASPG